MNKTAFPVYRKYSNNKSYFKITSKESFEELQLVGGKVLYHQVQAKQYPEKVMILDMIAMNDNRWEALTEKEFSKRLQLFKNHNPH